MTASPSEIARRHDEAWNAKDVEARKQCCAPDIETEMPGGMQLKGFDQVQPIEAAFWQALPDSQITRTVEFVDGDTVVAEGLFTGTQTGPFPTPQGEIPASGNPVKMRYASVKRVVDGKLVSEHLYFDQLELMMQIGAMPGPGG
ncbi:MAG: ester cyclase [Actinomycetota bacterium]